MIKPLRYYLTCLILLGDSSSVSWDVFRLTGVMSRLDDDPLRLLCVLPLWSSSSLTTSASLLLFLSVARCLVGVMASVAVADRFLKGPPFVGIVPRGLGISEYSFDFSYNTCVNRNIQKVSNVNSYILLMHN